MTSLKTQIEELEKMCKKLASSAFEYLHTHSISISLFEGKVACMGISLRASTIDFLDDCLDKIDHNASISKLWRKLSVLWDFLNFEFLEHVIDTFIPKREPIWKELVQYTKEVEAFCSRTKVQDFFQAWPFRMKKPEETKVRTMTLKADRSWEECTLEDIKKTTNALAQLFSMPHHFLLLRNVEEGCVKILWYVPPSLADFIREAVIVMKPEEMVQHGFTSIAIDGIQVYPFTATQHCYVHLRRLYELKFSCLKSSKHYNGALKPFKLAALEKPIISSKSDPYTRKYLRGNKDDVWYHKSPTILGNLIYLRNGRRSRLILIEGAPGVGKTTLTRIACLKWAKRDILTDISLLILFPLRDHNLRDISSLADLLAFVTQGEKSLVEELIQCKGEGVVFWLDGWDEIESSLDSSSVYRALVAGTILPRARVIVTSRPWATDFIKQFQNDRAFKHIEIISSVEDEIDWIVKLKKKIVPSKIVTFLDDVIAFLANTPAIRENMHTPLATSITLDVYQWCLDTGSPLPTTVTQLYTSYICCCIHKYLDKHPHLKDTIWKSNHLQDLPEPIKSWFISISQLGLDGLLDGKRLVFPDVPKNLRLEALGLMQAQDPLYTSGDSAVVSYHFNHLSVQEFLFAQLLSWLTPEERNKVVEQCIVSNHFTMVLRFLSGLNKSVPVSLAKIQELLDSGEEKHKLTIFHWLFEGCDKKTIAEIFGERKMKIHSDYTWSNLDYYVAGYCIARSKCQWCIDFNGAIMGDQKMTTFLQSCSCEDNQHALVSSLKLSSNELTSSSLCHLRNIPPSFISQLKEVDLSSNSLDNTALEEIASIIPHTPHLKMLNLCLNKNITNGGAVPVLSALNEHRYLTELYLQCTQMGKQDCKHLAKLLCSSQSLKILNVGNNSLSSDSVCTLFQGLQYSNCLKRFLLYSNWKEGPNSVSLDSMKLLRAFLQDRDKCKLETLDLTSCDIQPESASELAQGIAGNSTVKELRLCGNPIGDKGVTSLAQVLAENTSITELDFMHCNITTIGGTNLASSLVANSAVKELYIGGNLMFDQDVKNFSRLLLTNKTLQILDIRDDASLTQSNISTILKYLSENRTLKKLYLPEVLKPKVHSQDDRVEWIHKMYL